MTKLSAFARRSLAAPAVVAALMAGGAAQAGTIDFDYNSAGSVGLLSMCGPTCYDVGALGSIGHSVSLSTSWAFFAESLVDVSSPSFTGNWELHDLASSNDLSGTFTGTLASFSSKGATGSMAYVVTDGDGIFKGAKGTGSTTFAMAPDYTYTEKGSFHVSAVPEPGTWAMMGIGLLGLGAVARRRQA